MSCFGDKPKECVCKIYLLDDTSYNLTCKANIKGQHILSKVFEHLNLLEKDYFGLRFVDNANQTHWLDPLKSLHSQFRDACPPYSLYFGVKFYATDPCKLHEEITRYQFFLQVKKDVLQGRLPVAFDTSAELGAYAVQSELGDYDPKRHSYGYVSELRFTPNQTEELEERIVQIHRGLAGQVPSVAEFMYLDKAKWLDMYGVDLHPVQGEGSIEYFLGLTPTGIVVYKNKTRVGNYFWPRIVKVTFKSKTFMIRVRDKNNDENTYAFELASKSACKHLWKCCVEHHSFFRLNQVPDHNSGAGNVFSFGSKYRYSGRTEKEAQMSEVQGRRQPKVIRTPSKRYERRVSSDKSKTDTVTHTEVPPSPGKAISPKSVDVSNVQTPKTKRLSGYLASPESPATTHRSSQPWTSEQTSKGGLYTSGRDSPLSTRSEKMKFPTHRSRTKLTGNESEGETRRRGHSKKYSDNESEASTVLRHKRRGYDSGSETESRRSQRRGRQRRSGPGSGEWRRSDYNKENGSVVSGHGSDAGQVQRRRRRRSRSRSPGKKLPQELQNHIRYELVEASGLTEEQLRDIPFTNVQTEKANLWTGKYSPYARHRRRSPARRRSFGSEASSNFNNSRNQSTINSHNYNKPDELVIQPPQVVHKQQLHTANTVKTKSLSTHLGGTNGLSDGQTHPYTSINGYMGEAKAQHGGSSNTVPRTMSQPALYLFEHNNNVIPWYDNNNTHSSAMSVTHSYSHLNKYAVYSSRPHVRGRRPRKSHVDGTEKPQPEKVKRSVSFNAENKPASHAHRRTSLFTKVRSKCHVTVQRSISCSPATTGDITRSSSRLTQSSSDARLSSHRSSSLTKNARNKHHGMIQRSVSYDPTVTKGAGRSPYITSPLIFGHNRGYGPNNNKNTIIHNNNNNNKNNISNNNNKYRLHNGCFTPLSAQANHRSDLDIYSLQNCVPYGPLTRASISGHEVVTSSTKKPSRQSSFSGFSSARAWIHDRPPTYIQSKKLTGPVSSYKVISTLPNVTTVSSVAIPEITVSSPSPCVKQNSCLVQPKVRQDLECVYETTDTDGPPEANLSADENDLEISNIMSSCLDLNGSEIVAETSLGVQSSATHETSAVMSKDEDNTAMPPKAGVTWSNTTFSLREPCTLITSNGKSVNRDLTQTELLYLMAQTESKHHEILTEL